ncbi:hypothetical protein [Persicitalea jodogahamensis]|uniref:Uncharacterized protein n=1 Tax=Persicitalea jodogahamensis TaxID=402147 RepID=A0A8J3DDW3_9BACT|nr:hypothetical protein [Persicitalea jodogahamensis]GHB81339.1 hypothetical protein GCM10007390_40190 [Persicitalea jodogahamensis]
MRNCYLIILGIIGMNSWAYSQKSLLFVKNDSRYATYRSGDDVSFNINGSKQPITQRIQGFEDSLIVFPTWKLPVNDISALLVDDKTKRWYPLRYKYEQILPIAGAEYLVADLVNTGKFRTNTLLISGLLAGGGLLARKLIGDRITVKNKRRLVISGHEAGRLGSYK